MTDKLGFTVQVLLWCESDIPGRALVVVVSAAVGVFVVLNQGGGYDAVDGKFGAAPLTGCDDFAARAWNLPPKRSDTPLQGSEGWLCTYSDEANVVTCTWTWR